MMFVVCRDKEAEKCTEITEECLRSAGLEEFELEAHVAGKPGFAGAFLPPEDAVHVSVFARPCLRLDEEGVIEYDHDCGLGAVEREFVKLLTAFKCLAENERIGLAAITNVPGIWPWWGPLTADSLEENVKLCAFYVARDAPRTALEDSLLRTLLTREDLRFKPSHASFILGVIPFVDLKSLTEFLAFKVESIGNGLLFISKDLGKKMGAD